MGMTPEEYFESFVEGNFLEFQENSGCIRRGFNSIVSLSHLADHYYYYNHKNEPQKLSEFTSFGEFISFLNKSTNNNFKDIRSISNAYKHLYLGDNKFSNVDSTGSIETIRVEEDEIEEIKTDFEGDKWKVIFTRKDGSTSNLFIKANNVYVFWRSFLFQLSS